MTVAESVRRGLAHHVREVLADQRVAVERGGWVLRQDQACVAEELERCLVLEIRHRGQYQLECRRLGGTVEIGQRAQDVQFGFALEHAGVGFHHVTGMRARLYLVHHQLWNLDAAADVFVAEVHEVGAQQGEREGVVAVGSGGLAQFLLRALDAEVAQVLRAVLRIEVVEVLGLGARRVIRNIVDAHTRGADHQALVLRGQFLEQRFERRVLHVAGGVLQRLASIEEQQHTLLAQVLRQRLGLGVDRCGGLNRNPEKPQDLAEERVGRGLAIFRRALAVEGPTEDGGLVQVPAEPLVDERRLAGAACRDDLDEVGLRIGPGAVEKRQFRVAPQQRRIHRWELADECAVGGRAGLAWPLGAHGVEQQIPGGGLVLSHQIDVDEVADQGRDRAVRDPHRDQPPLPSRGIVAQRGPEFLECPVLSNVVRREQRDDMVGRQRFVHLVEKAVARPEIQVLKRGGVARVLQDFRHPLGILGVLTRSRDEDMRLGHHGSYNLPCGLL